MNRIERSFYYFGTTMSKHKEVELYETLVLGEDVTSPPESPPVCGICEEGPEKCDCHENDAPGG